MMDPREKKLPVWAREELRKARSNLAAAQEKLEALLHGAQPSENFPVVGDYVSGLRGRTLPCRVVEWPQLGIRVAIRDGMLDIQAIDKMLCVLPSSSNTIRVAVAGWDVVKELEK